MAEAEEITSTECVEIARRGVLEDAAFTPPAPCSTLHCILQGR